jgi:hypothetical protein
MVSAMTLGAIEASESGQKRMFSVTAIEDSGRGDGHDPNDNSCPMGVGGLGIWQNRSGSCRLASDRLVLIGRRRKIVG